MVRAPVDALAPPFTPWPVVVRWCLRARAERPPARLALWPDREQPLVRAKLQRAQDPFAAGPRARVVVVGAESDDDADRLVALARENSQRMVLVVPDTISAACLERLSRAPSLVRVLRRAAEAGSDLVLRASRATETLLREMVFRKLGSHLRRRALVLRNDLGWSGDAPASPARSERAPLQTTLWAHVHGVRGLDVDAHAKVFRLVGACAAAERRYRRDTPWDLLAATCLFRAPASRLSRLPADPREAIAALEGLADSLDEHLRAQRVPGVGDPDIPLFELEAKTIRTALERHRRNVGRTARFLATGEARVRAQLRQLPPVAA